MRGRAPVLLVLAVAAIAAAPAAEPVPPPERPAWCEAGWVCESIERARAAALEIARLRKREAELEARLAEASTGGVQRFGFCAGPSLSLLGEGVRQEPTGAYHFEWHSGAGVSLLWGLRFGGRAAPPAP